MQEELVKSIKLSHGWDHDSLFKTGNVMDLGMSPLNLSDRCCHVVTDTSEAVFPSGVSISLQLVLVQCKHMAAGSL